MYFPPSLSGLAALAVAVVLTALCALPAGAECQRAPVRYDLPPQRLTTGLEELTRRSGCPVTAVPALVRDKHSGAVRGNLTPDVALIAMIRGTGLEVDADHGGLEVNREQQQYFSARTSELGRQLAAQHLSPIKREALAAQIARIHNGVPARVREQGFLSAAQRVSYTASLDRVALRLKH